MDERSGQEWLDARFNSVTGTDVAKIMGCDDRVSPQKLLASKLFKLDLMANASEITKDLLKMGTVFEEAALSSFKVSMRGSEGFVPGMSPHPELNWFCGTPDFIGYRDDGSRFVVEVKTHFWPSPFEATPFPQKEAIPLKHWLQVQSYLEILDIDEGYLWSWTLSQGATCFRIVRDKEWWSESVAPKLVKFWSILCLLKENNCDIDPKSINLKWGRGEKQRQLDEVKRMMIETTTQVSDIL